MEEREDYFFATTINTVFTDEGMPFTLRGQSEIPWVSCVMMKHRNKGPKPERHVYTAVYMKPIQKNFYLKFTGNISSILVHVHSG